MGSRVHTTFCNWKKYVKDRGIRGIMVRLKAFLGVSLLIHNCYLTYATDYLVYSSPFKITTLGQWWELCSSLGNWTRSSLTQDDSSKHKTNKEISLIIKILKDNYFIFPIYLSLLVLFSVFFYLPSNWLWLLHYKRYSHIFTLFF